MRARSRRHLAPVVMVSAVIQEECAAAVTTYSALLAGGGFPVADSGDPQTSNRSRSADSA